MKTTLPSHTAEVTQDLVSILESNKGGRMREILLVTVWNAQNPNHPHLKYLEGCKSNEGCTKPKMGQDVKFALKKHSSVITYKIGNARFYELKAGV